MMQSWASFISISFLCPSLSFTFFEATSVVCKMPKRQRASSVTFLCPNPFTLRVLSPLKTPPLISTKCPLMMRMPQAAAAAISSLLIFIYPSPSFPLSDAQKLVAEAWRVVDQSYVDRTFNNHDWFRVRMTSVKRTYSSTDDGYDAIRQMLSLLADPYTRFLTPQQYTSLNSTATGEVVGVGVEMYPARVDDALKVTSPVDDSPAARAGVRPSDVITLIDGEDTAGLTPDEAAARIRGTPGTRVSLTVIHDDGKGEEESFDMVRESLKLKSVKIKTLKPGELYVKIKQFSSSTAGDMKEALESFGNGKIERLILDLRNNPGGYFPGGVDVAKLFVRSGTPIVYVVDKNGIPNEINAAVDGEFADLPVIVLVNKATASASEILAGALKDNNRAKLVGEQTFGKGVVQTVSQLSDGSGLAVTVARYETPAHKDINKIGIKPDVMSSCRIEADVHSCFPQDVWGA